jgi:hypothetical protein
MHIPLLNHHLPAFSVWRDHQTATWKFCKKYGRRCMHSTRILYESNEINRATSNKDYQKETYTFNNGTSVIKIIKQPHGNFAKNMVDDVCTPHSSLFLGNAKEVTKKLIFWLRCLVDGLSHGR